MAKNTDEKKWELFHVGYRLPKFGTENEYLPEIHTFKVSTQGGIMDAKETCERFHKGCKIVQVLDNLAYIACEGKFTEA